MSHDHQVPRTYAQAPGSKSYCGPEDRTQDQHELPSPSSQEDRDDRLVPEAVRVAFAGIRYSPLRFHNEGGLEIISSSAMKS